MVRRRALALLGGGGLLLAFSGRHGYRRLARPAAAEGPMSAEAEALVARAFAGLEPRRILDTHVHLVGLGGSGSGCWVNPNMRSPVPHPIQWLKFGIYKAAGGVTDDAAADEQYREQLVRLARGLRGARSLLLAFDQVHDEDGTPRPERSEFFTPNGYVLEVARAHPDLFVPAVSVHPYRQDAVEALEQGAAGGAVAVKWLPNAQRIDPSSPRCDAFYRKLAELGLTLVTHTGEEQAVEAEEAQRLGNPLHFRRALDLGARVVMCHMASLGENPDLDRGPDARARNFDLYLRLLDEPQYRGRLFGDVSALVQFNRAGDALKTVLERQDLHPRLVNGSDYPLPAINALVRTGTLEGLGYLTAGDRRLLNEIDQHNPLLFDFVLKRTLRSRAGTREAAFSDQIFTPGPDVFPRLPA